MIIGIREEDKSVFERRVAITPDTVEDLVKQGFKVIVEPSSHRVFKDEEFEKAGAELKKDLSEAKVIFGVKEIPKEKLMPEKTYVFFSHTIKGQSYNMPMLKRILELKDTLIDYEKITDDNGRRLIFFGRFAGFAGAIDALNLLGQKLKREGVSNIFEGVKRAYEYHSLEDAKSEIAKLKDKIEKGELPDEINPLIVGFAGYGNVSKGAQEIFDLLNPVEISPEELLKGKLPENRAIKVVFKEEHMVEPISSDTKFELQDYYKNPEKYRGIFGKYLPYLNVLVNAIYWEEKYPRLVTKEDVKKLWSENKKNLKIIADISCDIEGAIEFTFECGEPDKPSLVYEPLKDSYFIGISGDGPTVLMVDILPSELPRESSEYFSHVLKDFIPDIVKADYSVSYEELKLPAPIKRAVIAHKGELTPDYKYIEKYFKNS